MRLLDMLIPCQPVLSCMLLMGYSWSIQAPNLGGNARSCSPQPPPNHGRGPSVAAGVTSAVPSAVAPRVPSRVTPRLQVTQAGVCISVMQQCSHLCMTGVKLGLLERSWLQASLAAGVSAGVQAGFATSCGALAAACSQASGEAPVPSTRRTACPALHHSQAADSSLSRSLRKTPALQSALSCAGAEACGCAAGPPAWAAAPATAELGRAANPSVPQPAAGTPASLPEVAI